jgi:RNA polymerase sigma-70 factor (ECF subfamily)
MQEQQDDILIIQMILQGQQSAFATLVDKYQSYVFTLAMRYVNDRELAEELAQDIFVKAYRYLADFKGNSKFSTWLYTIVNTTCLSHLRKKKEDTILLEEERMISVSDNSFGEKPTDRLEQKTQQQLLEKAMKLLPETDAQLITLFYQGEQSIGEVGRIMGLTTSNVKVKLFRARQKLKEILETRYSRELIGMKSNNS